MAVMLSMGTVARRDNFADTAAHPAITRHMADTDHLPDATGHG
jgi:hypothetical protein